MSELLKDLLLIIKKVSHCLILDEDNWVDQFQDFFPKAVKEFEELFKTETFHTIISRIKEGQSIGPINMDKVPDPQRQDVDNVLDTWAPLERSLKQKYFQNALERG